MIRRCDTAIFFCLCAAIVCLPFSKAGLEIFVWAAVIAWLLKRILGSRTDGPWRLLPRTPLNRMLVVFVIANIMATVFSVHFGLSFKALLGKQLKFLAIFFMVAETIDNEKRLERFLFVILFTVFAAMVEGMVQFTWGVDLVRRVVCDRITGPFSNPNTFAGFLVILVPVVWGVVMVSHKMIFSVWVRLFLMIEVVLMPVCLIWTYSRGAWLGFGAGLVLMFLLVFQVIADKRRYISVLLAVAVIMLLLFSLQPVRSKIVSLLGFNVRQQETIGERIRSIGDVHQSSAARRIQLWQEALHIWKDFPVAGAGLNTYSRMLPQYKVVKDNEQYSHNSFLQMLAETGIVGLTAFLGVLVVFFREGWRHAHKYRSFLMAGLLSGVLGFLVHSFVDTNLYALQLIVLFWFMLGLSVAVMRIEANADGVTL
jgi:putative inorganic carbon (HCO3(-)) transporter